MYEVVDKEVNKELVEEVIKLTVITEMMWCWTRRLTWRSTRSIREVANVFDE